MDNNGSGFYKRSNAEIYNIVICRGVVLTAYSHIQVTMMVRHGGDDNRKERLRPDGDESY